MATMQTTQFAATIEKIVDAAGQGADFRTSDHFHMRLKNHGWMDLVIESWRSPLYHDRRNISVAHYYEQNGDLVADPEVEIIDDGTPVGLTQVYGYTRCMWEQDGRLMVAPRAKAEVMSFLTLWGRNLKDQGFIEAAKLASQMVTA